VSDDDAVFEGDEGRAGIGPERVREGRTVHVSGDERIERRVIGEGPTHALDDGVNVLGANLAHVHVVTLVNGVRE
jgi:hypothetical protein